MRADAPAWWAFDLHLCAAVSLGMEGKNALTYRVQSWLRISCEPSVSVVLDHCHGLEKRQVGQAMSLRLLIPTSCVAAKVLEQVVTSHWMVNAHVGLAWSEYSSSTNLDVELGVSHYDQRLVISCHKADFEVPAEHSTPHVLLLAGLCYCACCV